MDIQPGPKQRLIPAWLQIPIPRNAADAPTTLLRSLCGTGTGFNWPGPALKIVVSVSLPITQKAAGPHSALIIVHPNLIVMVVIIRTDKDSNIYGNYFPQPAHIPGKSQ